MVRLFSLIALLGAVTSSISARFVCPGGRKTDTGKGMAAFRYVKTFYNLDNANEASLAYFPIEGSYERMFDCTDACWRMGPQCDAIVYTEWDKQCKMIKKGHMMNIIAFEPYIGSQGNLIAMAFKAEGEWKGACDSQTAKSVPYNGTIPHEGCCDIWY